MQEHWEYQGARTPYGYDPSVDGKPCYWFRLDIPGAGGTTRIIPKDEFWSKSVSADT